jgi:transposase
VISPIEVFSADDLGRRRDWSDEEKVRIVEESLQGFRQGSVTARRYLSRSLLTRWRREYRSGLLTGSASPSFVPLAIPPPPASSSEMTALLRFEGDRTIEIGLPKVVA